MIPLTRRLALLLLCALLMPAAFGLGITPAQVVLTPDDHAFTFRPLTDGPVTVHAEGDLAQYITFERTAVQPGEEIRGSISLPAGTAPGSHQEYIVITAAPASGGTAAGQAQVAASLQVRIPYPEEYLEANWDITHDPAGGSLITVTLENQGSRAVTPQVTVSIAGESLRLESGEVAPSAFAQAQSPYAPSQPGVYDATLLVEYSDQRITKSRTESFGTPSLAITSVRYNDETGQIKPIDIAGRVGWNRPLNTTITIYLDNDTTPAHTESVMAEGEFSIRLYVTTGRHPQTVTAVASIGDVTARQRVEVGEALPQQIDSLTPLLIGALLLVIIIALIIWYRRRPPKLPDTTGERNPNETVKKGIQQE